MCGLETQKVKLLIFIWAFPMDYLLHGVNVSVTHSNLFSEAVKAANTKLHCESVPDDRVSQIITSKDNFCAFVCLRHGGPV